MQIVEVLQGDKLTEVEFPDDMSPEAIEEVLSQEFPPASEQVFSADTPSLFSSASPVEDQSIFRSFADVPLKIGSGLAIGAKGIAEAFGADSAVAENIEGIEGFLDSLLSAQSRADSAEISRLQQEAQDKGFLDQAIAALKGISTAPIDFTAQTIGTALPIIAGTAAATFAGAPASVVTALGVGAGSLMGTGIVKGAIFDVVEEELLKANVSPEEAEAVAQEAQSYKGGNLDQIGLGAILGAWAARSGLEPAIGRLISGNIARRGILKGAAIGATAEAFPEGLQGAQEQLARNLAQIREAGIDDVPLYRGVAGAGTLEGLAGGIGGGVFGAASSGAIADQPGDLPTTADLSEITETTGEPEPAPEISEDVLRTQTLEKLDLIAPNLRGTLKGRGLDDIGLKLSYNLENLGGMARPEEIDALYDPDVKTIFLGADRIKGFADMDAPQLQREFGGLVDHEMVHAVKRMNLWKDSEWRVLENAARKNFNSEGATYLQTAQERYSTDTAEIQSEEAIAELIRDTLAGRTKLSGQPLNLMQRLLEFFRKMGNSLTGTGYASFNQVVNDIDTGVLGARPRGGRQATPVGTSIIGGSPALASRRVNSNIQGQQVMNLEGMTGEQVAAEELRLAEQTTRQEQAAVGVAETRRILDSTEEPLASRGRLDRAKEQRFDTDTVYYHGTGQTFDEFDPSRGTRARTDTGVYLSENPLVASTYTGEARDGNSFMPQVLPVYTRLKNPITVYADGNYWSELGPNIKVDVPQRVIDQSQDADLLEELGFDRGSDTRTEPMGTYTLRELFPKEMAYNENNLTTDAIARWAKQQGVDGVIFEDIIDRGVTKPKGADIKIHDKKTLTPTRNLVVFDAQNIRSVNAEFAASAVGSSNLLASRGAVSTRFPTAKRRIVNPIEELIVNQYQDYLDGPTFAKNMGVINSYDELLGSGTDIEQAQKFVEHVKNNLLFVYDSIDPQIRERSAKWYEGANKLMQKLADKHGLTLEQTAAVAANLSPQKDWYMNASLAERVVDIYQESINESFTPEMEAKGVELFTAPLKGKDRTPTKIKNRKQNIERLETIKGKSLADLVAEEAPLLDQAMWIRIYDQTYNSPSYQVLSPEGEYVGAALNQDGAKSKSGWGSLNEIAKGLIALQDGSLSSISPSLGDANKVRNFYNNIYDPYAEEGFVTIDTHAVAAGLLRPLGGSAPQVSANFGTLKGVGNSSVTGHKGVYSLYEEAYRRAAEEKNILPREMQSITWEGIRGLFSADYKQDEANQEFANNIWKQYSNGSITLDKVREEILRHADQFSDPEWARPNYGNVEVERTSGYERKLSDAGVSRLGGEGVGSRGRVDATGRASAKKLKTKPEDSSALAADKSKALTENNEDLESDQAASEQLTTVKKLASRNNASDIVESTAYNRVADISSKRASRGQGNINNALPFEAPSSADDRGIVYQVQDKYIDLKNSIEAVKKNRLDRGLTPLIDTENPYLGEESMHGIIGNKFNRFQEDEIIPLVDKLVAKNISRKEFEEFLVLRHSIERNENVRKINAKSKKPRADLADGGAGSLNGQRLLDNYVKNEMQSKYGMRWNDSTQSWEGGNRKALALNDLSADFDSITRGTLQELKNSGLINQESLDKLNSHYKYYAPLRGLSPDEDIAIEERARLTGRANNLSISGIETEKAKGRVSESTPPLGQIMMQRQSAIKRGTINEVVGQRMLNVIRENPNNSYWMIHEERADAGSGSGELFGVKEDGKQLFVEFKDARLREAMLSLDAAQSGKILGFLRGVNRYYSAIMTQYNPEFVIGNFFRDVGTAMGNLVGEQAMVGGKAINTKGLKRAVIADVLPSIRQVYRGLRGNDLKGDLARDWKEYLESGAKTEWFYAKSPEESSADVDKLIEMAKGTFKGNMRSGKEAIAGFVSDTNSAVENGVRFATFKKARDLFIKNGVPRDLALAQAATLAKNLTVNFNRKGNSGELLNGLYLFFNASVQGTANFVRGLSSPAKQRMLGAMVSFGALVTLINEEGSEEDDKGDSYYSQIDPWRKERNLIFMKTLNPFYTGPPNAAYSIPLPYGYNVLHLLGVNAVEVGMGLESPQLAAGEMVSAALGSFAPVGFGTSKNPATFVLKGATPQIGKPLMEILLNEDFFGSPIYTENFSFGDQVPLSYLAQRSTPEAFKKTTKFLNELTGGNESMGGKYVDLSWISPDALDYLVGTQVGGLGSFVERSAKSIGALGDYAQGDYKEGDISVNDIPFIRRGMFEITGRKSQSDYYDRRDDILAYDRQAGLLKGRERGDYIRENRPYLLMNRTMESTDKRLRNINKQLRAVGDMILSSPSIEQTIKLEERQKKLEDMKQSTYDRFNKRFNEKVGRTE